MKADVLIVGGGLVGCTAALMLARDGVDVVLVEAAGLHGQASGANAGSIHLQIPYAEFCELGEQWATRFADVLPMMRRSVALWEALGDELGDDCAVTRRGGLLVAETAEQMALIEKKAAIERAGGVDTEVIDRAELRSLAPYIAERMIGAAWCRQEGKGNPLRAGPAIARAARAAGAQLIERCAVLSLERERSGWRAHTSSGAITAGRVVNAAGASAARVAAMAGVDIDVAGFPIQATVTEAAEPIVPHLVYSAAARLTLKQMGNGTIVIGGGWPSRVSRDGRLCVSAASLAANMGTARATVPAVGRLRAVRTWPAFVNGTTDWLPLLGEAPGARGFFLALFPWMGFTGAPITARVVSDLVLGRTADVDPSLLMAA